MLQEIKDRLINGNYLGINPQETLDFWTRNWLYQCALLGLRMDRENSIKETCRYPDYDPTDEEILRLSAGIAGASADLPRVKLNPSELSEYWKSRSKTFYIEPIFSPELQRVYKAITREIPLKPGGKLNKIRSGYEISNGNDSEITIKAHHPRHLGITYRTGSNSVSIEHYGIPGKKTLLLSARWQPMENGINIPLNHITSDHIGQLPTILYNNSPLHITNFELWLPLRDAHRFSYGLEGLKRYKNGFIVYTEPFAGAIKRGFGTDVGTYYHDGNSHQEYIAALTARVHRHITDTRYELLSA